jgi:hypothetical protein
MPVPMPIRSLRRDVNVSVVIFVPVIIFKSPYAVVFTPLESQEQTLTHRILGNPLVGEDRVSSDNVNGLILDGNS